MADVDGDGSTEVIVTGNVYNCGTSPYTSLYEMAYIFNADRSRWQADPYDWEAIPVPDGAAAPLSEDYNVIESNMSNPVAADLNGDGLLEILFPSYDGRLHVYWLDKSERYNWPYDVAATGPGIRFASEPVVVDLDGNGTAEVLFASWPQKAVGGTGKLHVLDYRGAVLYEINLPAPYGSAGWNGALAAPTVADIDGDPDLELVLTTAHSGLVAYDLPGTAAARRLWSTGRGNQQRSGSFLHGLLSASSLSMTPVTPAAGETVVITIVVDNQGPDLESVSLVNPLPAALIYAGNLTATSGSAAYSAGQVTWAGAASGAEPVIIRYEATVNGALSAPTMVTMQAQLDDGVGTIWPLNATIIANGDSVFLPLSGQE
jgi:hypothetical protein